MEEKKSSTRVHRITGSFIFSIEGFSGLSNRVGDSTESPEFDLCEHTWQLRIFPGSYDVELSVRLQFLQTKSFFVFIKEVV